MSSKLLQTLAFLVAGIIALAFVKLMFDMNRSMAEMTGHVGSMAQEVREMRKSMQTMNDSMQRMEKSVHGMGQAFNVGSKQIQQMNPADMLQQMFQRRGP